MEAQYSPIQIEEKWSKISESYGKMILGYFGNTPTDPDPEIMKIASKQLNLEPTKEDVHDLNDDNPNLGVEYNKNLLKEKGIDQTDENIFSNGRDIVTRNDHVICGDF